jgi:myo-inositol-1(or 4)-monophosphatase
VEAKGHNDFVSHVDRTSERMIVDALRTLLPDAGFITEEGTARMDHRPLKWVIDPLDGTTNFIHGVPFFAVSIGLVDGINPILGVVHELGRMETFTATAGGGAYMNGSPIHVSQSPTVAQSLLGTGFPYTDFGQMERYLDLFRHLMQHSRGLRRPGSAATDLAYVACGRFDGFFEYGLSPWDVAAGACLVREAGGTVTDFAGGDTYINGRQIVAANALTHGELRSTVARFML